MSGCIRIYVGTVYYLSSPLRFLMPQKYGVFSYLPIFPTFFFAGSQLYCKFAPSQVLALMQATLGSSEPTCGRTYIRMRRMKEEKKYPVFDEEDGFGTMSAAEPAVAYATREMESSGVAYMGEEAEKIDRIPLGMFGFYTDDPEVFEQRVAEMEADMDEVDAGIEDPEKWISSEQMWAELYQKYPWLR